MKTSWNAGAIMRNDVTLARLIARAWKKMKRKKKCTARGQKLRMQTRLLGRRADSWATLKSDSIRRGVPPATALMTRDLHVVGRVWFPDRYVCRAVTTGIWHHEQVLKLASKNLTCSNAARNRRCFSRAIRPVGQFSFIIGREVIRFAPAQGGSLFSPVVA